MYKQKTNFTTRYININLFISFFLGLRYLFGNSNNFFNKLTNISSIISMLFGTFSMITVISIMNGFEDELKNSVFNFIPHVIISNTKNSMNRLSINKNDIFSKNVKYVSEIIFSDVIIQSHSDISIGSVISIDNDRSNIFKPYIKHSKSLDFLKTNHYFAIIGKGLANKLNINIGDTFKLITPNLKQFSLFGSVPNQRTFTLIDIFITNNEIDNYQILVNQKDLSQFLHYPKNHITGLRVWLKDPLDAENYMKNFHLPNKDIKIWKKNLGELLRAAKIEKYMMISLFSLVIIISIFSIIVSISLLIMDKERDIAIFQTLGLSRYNIMLIFVFQGLFSGVTGILLGTLLSFFVLNKITGIMSIMNLFSLDFSLPYSIIPIQIIIINCLSITCILLSIIYLSWKATMAFPSKRLAYE
ncbi:MAG: FtsX-like permease family protein [Buchnera aphidicola (Floraphis choui)]